MATNKVELCGVDTASLPVIKNERMRELFPRVHAGDRAARNEFIQGNLRLVLSVIQRFQSRGESVDDLFQVGCIGLMKAIDNFDVTQNVRFSTYAVPMMVGCRKRTGGGICSRRLSFQTVKKPRRTRKGRALSNFNRGRACTSATVLIFRKKNRYFAVFAPGNPKDFSENW